MSILSGIKIEAIAASLPENEIDNQAVGRELFGEALDNLIISTGVRKRRICKNPDTTALDLSLHAAETIYSSGEIKKQDIGAIVFVTFTPEKIMPNNASLCQHRLNLATNIPVFDINLACSGYVYGLWVAGMMANNLSKKVLLLDGDKQSHIFSPKDKVTSLLFSDAGSATIIAPCLSSGETQSNWYFSFFSDGSMRNVLEIEDGGSKNWFSRNSTQYHDTKDGNKIRKTDISMDGFEVFKFVVKELPENIKHLVESSEYEFSDINYLVLHQANQYMIKQVAKRLKFSPDQVPLTINKYGNSSSATIPVTIASELSAAVKNKKCKVILSGFGAGLSIGSAIIDLDSCHSYGIIDYYER